MQNMVGKNWVQGLFCKQLLVQLPIFSNFFSFPLQCHLLSYSWGEGVDLIHRSNFLEAFVQCVAFDHDTLDPTHIILLDFTILSTDFYPWTIFNWPSNDGYIANDILNFLCMVHLLEENTFCGQFCQFLSLVNHWRINNCSASHLNCPSCTKSVNSGPDTTAINWVLKWISWKDKLKSSWIIINCILHLCTLS